MSLNADRLDRRLLFPEQSQKAQQLCALGRQFDIVVVVDEHRIRVGFARALKRFYDELLA